MTDEIFNYFCIVSSIVVWAGTLAYMMNSSKFEKMRSKPDEKVLIHLMSIGVGIVGFLWPFVLSYYISSKLVIGIGKLIIPKKEEI